MSGETAQFRSDGATIAPIGPAPASPPVADQGAALERLARERLLGILNDESRPFAEQLYMALRLVNRYRAEALRAALIEHVGTKVQSGPFAGMQLLPQVIEGCYMPKLLGTYEMELHPTWLRLRQRRAYRTILDIGAADGYYAVGLALMFPQARLLARDTDPRSATIVQEAARRNGVAERIAVGGRFTTDDFASEAQGQTLVLCDIEGEEQDLLDPAKAPALRGCDIVVELHETPDKPMRRLMYRRFDASHDIAIVEERGRDVALPPMFDRLDSIDRLLATWEFRSQATPWAVMRARKPAS